MSVWDGVTIWEDLQSGEALVGFGTESGWRSQLRGRVGLGMLLISGYFPLIEITIKINNYRDQWNISLEIQG